MNGTIPIAVAARLKIPVVDADCMGRAFPEVQLVIPHLYGVPATPLIIADEKGNSAVLSTINNEWTENIARAISSKMGGMALMALYTMDGKTAKKATLPDMLSFTIKIGRTLRDARARKLDILAELLKVTKGVCYSEEKSLIWTAHGQGPRARRGDYSGFRRFRRANSEHAIPERKFGGAEREKFWLPCRT